MNSRSLQLFGRSGCWMPVNFVTLARADVLSSAFNVASIMVQPAAGAVVFASSPCRNAVAEKLRHLCTIAQTPPVFGFFQGRGLWRWFFAPPPFIARCNVRLLINKKVISLMYLRWRYRQILPLKLLKFFLWLLPMTSVISHSASWLMIFQNYRSHRHKIEVVDSGMQRVADLWCPLVSPLFVPFWCF